MRTHSFDVIVIGAGSGGLNVASFANRVGLRTLLIDRSDAHIGGDCLNTGCVPSKALIHVSRLVAEGARAAAFGPRLTGTVDFARVRAHVQGVQKTIREHENADYFRAQGMEVVLGEASFFDSKTVWVGAESYTAKRIVIATGSRPRKISFSNLDEVPVYTNETFFDAETLPADLLVVGGGPIGFELGQASARLGAKVTIITHDDQWLAKEERAQVAVVMAQMEREGVRFIPRATLVSVSGGKAYLSVDGEEFEVPCSGVLASIGRAPNLETLNLAAAGIEMTESGGLVLDRTLRTTNHRVYAVGDVVGQHQFTHAAEVHAALVLKNFFVPRLFASSLDTDSMGWVTYTDPEIATFGLSKRTLTARGISYTELTEPFSRSDRAITDGATEGLLTLYLAPRSGRILGGTMVGRSAGELVGELMLAQRHRMTARDLFARVYPYPTAARINRLAAGTFLARKLTGTFRRALRALFALVG